MAVNNFLQKLCKKLQVYAEEQNRAAQYAHSEPIQKFHVIILAAEIFFGE